MTVPVSKGPILGETLVFHFTLCDACCPQLGSWPLLWASALHGPVTLCIVQENLLFILLLLRLFLNICIFVFFVFISTRKTPQTTTDRWSISFPMRVDSPSLTPFQSFLMHRKFCYLQALQKMRFEHCFQLGASKSLLLLFLFSKYPYLETLNSMAFIPKKHKRVQDLSKKGCECRCWVLPHFCYLICCTSFQLQVNNFDYELFDNVIFLLQDQKLASYIFLNHWIWPILISNIRLLYYD